VSARPMAASAREVQMLDLLMVALATVFFAASFAYVAGCDRL
jgi:hypothetical protein